MALLKTEAAKLSNNTLEAGVIEEIIYTDEFFQIFPFMRVTGKAYVYDRESTLATADWLDPNDAVNEGASTFTEVTSYLRILIGDVDVDKFLDVTMSDTNDQKAIQIQQKARGLANKFKDTLINGDNSQRAKEPSGVIKLLSDTPSQIITAGANGAALTLGMLDELYDAVPNKPDVFVMRKGTARAFRALMRAAGGNDALMLQMENFGRPMLHHNGVPILINDFIPGNVAQGNASATCSVFAMRLNEADGLHGIYGGDSAGIIVEDIGTVQNKDATRTRLKWYAGVALKSTRSLAGLVGITNV